MKCLTIREAQRYLDVIDLEIDGLGQITDRASQRKQRYRTTCRAPRNARELFSFSRHVAGWLPTGDWKLVQIDNSTMPSPDESPLIAHMLAVPDGLDWAKHRAFLFEFADNEFENQQAELHIADLIFAFLLVESHVYIVSSGGTSGNLVAIQGGGVQFSSMGADGAGIDLLLEEFRREPLMSPKWVVELISARQSQQ
jgi:hypothetical protein